MKKVIKKSKGTSLIEIVFAIGVIALVLTAIVSLSVRSVGVTSTSANQTRANRLAEEAIEWFRINRDSDPQAFFAQANSHDNQTLCFNTLPSPTSWGSASNCGTSVIVNSPFKRTVYIDVTGNEVSIDVVVEGGGTTVEHRTSLTDPRAR